MSLFNLGLCNGSAAGFCRDLRATFDENPDYDMKNVDPQTDEIVAVSFTAENREMLSKLEHLITKGYLQYRKNVKN